jgi:hypothetical protein
MTAALAAFAVAAASALPTACRPTACTLLACSPVHARITAHVNAPLAALVSAKTTVCWREVCSDLVAASDAGTSTGVGFDARMSSLRGDASVTAEGAGATRLAVELQFYTRARDGDFVYTRQANGDRYRVTVVDAAGTTLFDAEQAATYEESYANGPDCDPDPCRTAVIDLTQ